MVTSPTRLFAATAKNDGSRQVEEIVLTNHRLASPSVAKVEVQELTPIGTPVVLPRAGKVTRLNWDAAANGVCVEVRYTDGMLAQFVHLNEAEVKEGQTLSAGTEIGKSGNTGRSVAAHLHYALKKGSAVVDPVVYHGTLRRTIQPDALPRFQQEAVELLAQLDGALAAR